MYDGLRVVVEVDCVVFELWWQEECFHIGYDSRGMVTDGRVCVEWIKGVLNWWRSGLNRGLWQMWKDVECF